VFSQIKSAHKEKHPWCFS